MSRIQDKEKMKKMQSERLTSVLKDLNVTQAHIVRTLKSNASISISPERMSDFVTGKRIITDEVLNGLKMHFFINPKYIKGKSNDMYDIPETIINYAFLFAQEIVITENPNRVIKDESGNSITEKYLHITMDKTFFDYLINLDTLMIANESNNMPSLDKNIEILKELYKNSKHEYEEYVLLPQKTMFDIVKNPPPKRPPFPESIYTELYKDLPNECNAMQKKLS